MAMVSCTPLHCMYTCSTEQRHMYIHVQHHTVLHVTCVQTAATRHTIRCTQLSPYPVCWDLLPSLAIVVQSDDGLSHWPYEEQSAGTVIDIRVGSHQYRHTCMYPTCTAHDIPVQHHTVLNVTCVQTAATLHTIRCTQLLPYSVCWDLLLSPATTAQSHHNRSQRPYEEQSAGSVIDTHHVIDVSE